MSIYDELNNITKMKRDMKEEIRYYKLVRWYPSLPLGWSPEHEYLFDGKTNIISNLSKLEDCFKTEHEINLIELDFPNYWKEKRKPLFTTEDGVEVFDKDFNFILVDYVFEKFYASYVELVKPLNTDIFKYFAHESNADEYIWRNKKVFSYEDMMKAKHSIILADEDIEKAAKERAEQ